MLGYEGCGAQAAPVPVPRPLSLAWRTTHSPSLCQTLGIKEQLASWNVLGTFQHSGPFFSAPSSCLSRVAVSKAHCILCPPFSAWPYPTCLLEAS